MKPLLATAFLVSILATFAHAQFGDSLTLSHRKFLQRHIYDYRKETFWTYSGGLMYYRLAEQDNHQRIGFLASNLRPYLTQNPTSYRLFKTYRTKRLLAYPLDVATVSFGFAWLGSSLNNLVQGYPFVPAMLNRRNSLWWLAGYFASAYTAIWLRYSSENDLLDAVLVFNHRIKEVPRKNSVSLGIQVVPTPFSLLPAIGARWNF